MIGSAMLLVGLAGGDRWTRLAAAAMVGLMGSICSQLPGRWDFMTVGLLLSGLALLLYASEKPWRELLWQSLASGILVGLAVASTPRALPLVASAASGLLLALLLDGEARVRLLSAASAATLTAVCTQALLLAPLGLTPWSWLQAVRKASHGDTINSSPLMGGGSWTWGLALIKLWFS